MSQTEASQRCPRCGSPEKGMTRDPFVHDITTYIPFGPYIKCLDPWHTAPVPAPEPPMITPANARTTWVYQSSVMHKAEPASPDPPRPKSGLHHNVAKCCMEAWLDGVLIGEIVDGLEKEVYANWYAGLFSLVDDKNKPTAAPRCEDICTGCYNGLSYCDCEPAAAPTGACPICGQNAICDHQGWVYNPDERLKDVREKMAEPAGLCESCGARLETPHVCEAHIVTAAPTGTPRQVERHPDDIALDALAKRTTKHKTWAELTGTGEGSEPFKQWYETEFRGWGAYGAWQKLNDLRSQLEEAQAELQSVLDDWNDLVKASGSRTNGGAVGHVAKLVRDLATAREELVEAQRQKEDEVTEYAMQASALRDDLATAQARIARLEEACQKIEPEIGWRGFGEKARDYFYCEFCGANDLNCTKVPHKSDCAVSTLRAALVEPQSGEAE